MSALTPPPADLPSILDPATFAERGQAFVNWEAQDFYPYLAALSVYFPLKYASSVSTIALTEGVKNIEIQTGKSFPADTPIRVTSAADLNDYLLGTVISYDEETGALSFTATDVYGTGSFSDWQIMQTIPSSVWAGVQQLGKSTDITAATTTDLGTATGNDVTITHVSGDVDITGFGGVTDYQAGTRIRCRASIAAGTLTLVHNATSMILESLDDIEVADGDSWDSVKISDADAHWQVENYTRASGKAVVESEEENKAAIRGHYSTLSIINNTGTPNSQLDITATNLVLKDSSGRAFLAESVSCTANIAASGVNGLDTGTEANSTWYYPYVILNGIPIATGNASSTSANKLVDATADFTTAAAKVGDIVKNTTDGTSARVTAVDSATQLSLSANIMVSGEAYELYACASLLSASSTTPTLPSGYTYFAQVGEIYNNSSGNFIGIENRNDQVEMTATREILNGSLTVDIWTAVNITAFFPPTAKTIKIQMGGQQRMGLSPYSNGTGGEYFIANTSGGNTGFNGNFPSQNAGFTVNSLLYKSSIYYFVSGAGAFLYATGWSR